MWFRKACKGLETSDLVVEEPEADKRQKTYGIILMESNKILDEAYHGAWEGFYFMPQSDINFVNRFISDGIQTVLKGKLTPDQERETVEIYKRMEDIQLKIDKARQII